VNVARLLVALLLVLPAKSQQSVPVTEISFERVNRASKEYLRDSAELPLHFMVDFSATDLTGRSSSTGRGNLLTIFTDTIPVPATQK
jgi:hypothetical protein